MSKGHEYIFESEEKQVRRCSPRGNFSARESQWWRRMRDEEGGGGGRAEAETEEVEEAAAVVVEEEQDSPVPAPAYPPAVE